MSRGIRWRCHRTHGVTTESTLVTCLMNYGADRPARNRHDVRISRICALSSRLICARVIDREPRPSVNSAGIYLASAIRRAVIHLKGRQEIYKMTAERMRVPRFSTFNRGNRAFLGCLFMSFVPIQSRLFKQIHQCFETFFKQSRGKRKLLATENFTYKLTTQPCT